MAAQPDFRWMTFPYSTATAPSSIEVPGVWDCALEGRTFMLDTSKEIVGPASVPINRVQADTSDRPGEATLNRDDSWRRTFTSWHHGAGQEWADDDEADPFRFYQSSKVDVWTKNQLSLLHDVAEVVDSSSTNLTLLNAGTVFYAHVGTGGIKYSTDGTSWSDCTGLGTWVSHANSLATDGEYVFATNGSDIYRAALSSPAAFTSWNTLNCTVLGWANNRLMAAQDAAVYNVTSSSAPSALFTHPTAAWEWVGFASGQTQIYAAGYAGSYSCVYRFGLNSDGSALSAPIVALELPQGEVVNCLVGYLGYVILGTTRGFRVCQQGGDGSLTSGPVITDPGSVRCLAAWGKYIWFGWSNQTATTTGLGRMDLSTFVQPGVPAFAADVAADVAGTVVSCIVDAGTPMFSVSGDGVFRMDDTWPSEGWLDSGQVSWGISDDKLFDSVSLKVQPLDGTVNVDVATDDGSWVDIGSAAIANQTSAMLTTREAVGARHKVRLTLTPSASDTPVVTRYAMVASPVVARGEVWQIPLLLHEVMTCNDGQERSIDPGGMVQFIRGLSLSGLVVPWQIAGDAYRVRVEDYEFARHSKTRDKSDWNGTLTVRLRTPPRSP